MPKRMELKVPAIHSEYKVQPITDFFDGEDKARGWTTGRKLSENHPELVSETAERDSQLAQEQGIPDGTNWVLFIGKDRVWSVCRGGAWLFRYGGGLGAGFFGRSWVARPSE